MSDVRQWLEDLDLGQYADVFEREEVTPADISELTDTELKDLGLPLGPRKRILRAATGLSAKKESATHLDKPQNEAHYASVSSEVYGERRQLTVMFCDLVGSTQLSQKLDPEELRRLIRQYQDACAGAVARYEGHIAQFLGDGVLVYFGYPKAHEGEAERAIRAGLDIVKRVGELSSAHKLQVRIGIDTGLVVIGQGEALDEQERTAIGDAPNVAARLQSLAEPGMLVISERTRQIAGGSFDYQDLGAHQLKGINEPMKVWHVSGVREVETRFDAATGGMAAPMVGRDMELDVALHAWERVRKGKLQVLLLCGEPGIGKSRVLRAIREKLTKEGAQAWQFQCSPYFSNSALYPLVSHFERLLRFDRNVSPEQRLERLETMMKDRFGRRDRDVNLIGRLFGLPVNDKYGPLEMSPQKSREETNRVLIDMTEHAGKEQPVLLLYEDVHWADPTTLENIELAINREGIRGLIVMTYRPEFKPPWIGQPHVIALTLGRLDAEQTEQVVTRVAGNKRLPKEIVEQITLKTDGVPLFVEELTRAVLDSSLLSDQGDHYDLIGTLSPLAIPASLSDSLMARIDRSVPVKEIAQTGACIGREFSHEVLAIVSPLSQQELNNAIEQLIDSELVFKRGSAADAVHIFKHALIQDAAYESLLKSKRAEMHARIAEALEQHFPETADTRPELLAHHYTEAGKTASAIKAWLKAGENAYTRSALKEAIAHLQKGLSVLLDQEESAERDQIELAFRVVLGNSLYAVMGFAAQETGDNHVRSLSLARTYRQVPEIFQIHFGLAAHLVVKGELMAACEHSEAFLAEAEELGDKGAAVVSERCLGAYRFILGDLQGARDALESALAGYGKGIRRDLIDLYGHDPRVLGLCYLAQTLWILGYPDCAIKAISDASTHADAGGHVFSRCFARGDGSHVFVRLREPALAMQNAKIAVELAEDHGLTDMLGMARVLLGWSLACEGQQDHGISLIRQGLTTYGSSGAKVHSTRHLYALADALFRDGRVAEALDAIDEAIEVADEINERYYLAGLYEHKGMLLSKLGEREVGSAVGLFKKATDVARSQHAKSWELRASTSLARLWKQQGMPREAHDLLEPVYNWFTEGFDTKDLKEAKALLDELEVTA
ncbi:MAG: AAA family ATPase [Betaproteobacteria bacterium]|nr:MAG: AAA family ATPase [Betaproteobacteria bacterium]